MLSLVPAHSVLKEFEEGLLRKYRFYPDPEA